MRKLLLGLIVGVLLVGVNGNVWGQCEPGPGRHQPGYGIEDAPYMGLVPIPQLPAGYPGTGCPGPRTHVNQTGQTDYGCSAASSGWTTSLSYMYCFSGGGCGGYNHCWGYQYECVPENNSADYDCDGIPDVTDPDPMNPPEDADNDGVLDEFDPWPDDPDCPGDNKYRKYVFKHKTKDAVVEYYDCIGGTCETTWSCTGEDCDNLEGDWPTDKPDNYRTTLDMREYDWAELFPESVPGGVGENDTPPTDTTNGELGGILDELRSINSKQGVLVSKGADTVSQLEDLNSKASSTNSKLDEIKGAIEGIDVSVDMSGVEGRLDVANSKLQSINDDMIKMGTGELPDGDTSLMENNDDITGSALESIQEDAETEVRGWLDGFFNDNPIIALINGAGVEYAGAQSSVSVSFGGFSTTLDFAPAEPYLAVIGVFFLSFCGLAGLIDFLRG